MIPLLPQRCSATLFIVNSLTTINMTIQAGIRPSGINMIKVRRTRILSAKGSSNLPYHGHRAVSSRKVPIQKIRHEAMPKRAQPGNC